MIWWMIGFAFVSFGWPLLGIAVITWVDDDQQRLWKWVSDPKDDIVFTLLILAWPAVVCRWIRQKQ